MVDYNQARQMLTDHGLKVTHQRLAIYTYLVNAKAHPTAEKIFNDLSGDYPALSLGTVYKTLDALVQTQLINRVALAEGSARYDAKINDHHHIYCSDTDEIIDYDDDKLTQILKDYFKNKNITNLNIEDIRLQIKGSKIDPKQEIKIID